MEIWDAYYKDETKAGFDLIRGHEIPGNIYHLVSEEQHSIYHGYLCITDCPKDSIILQEGETIAYRWVSKMYGILNGRGEERECFHCY